jgi:hypothetical protein
MAKIIAQHQCQGGSVQKHGFYHERLGKAIRTGLDAVLNRHAPAAAIPNNQSKAG